MEAPFFVRLLVLFLLSSYLQAATLSPVLCMSASISPFPVYQLVGGCVSTELHGLIFQDMGFTVYEYSFWDPQQLCMDPSMLLDVVEVERPSLTLSSYPTDRSMVLSLPSTL